MIVGGETGFLELAGLDVAELAECDAHLHAEFADLAHGLEHRLEFCITVAHAFPRRAHTEAGGAIFPRRLGDWQNLIHGHEALFLQPRIVVRALGAVAAILTATSGLHAEQRAKLDFVFRPEFQENTAAFLNEIEEGAAIGLLETFQSGFHDGRFSDPEEPSQSAEWATNPLEPHGTDTILATLQNQKTYAIRTTRTALRRHGT